MSQITPYDLTTTQQNSKRAKPNLTLNGFKNDQQSKLKIYSLKGHICNFWPCVSILNESVPDKLLLLH